MSRCETMTTPRRQPTDDAPRSIPAASGDLARAAEDLLNAIRGYCELATIKGENGDALARRMTAAIATVDELSLLILELLARLDGTRPSPEADEDPRSGAAPGL